MTPPEKFVYHCLYGKIAFLAGITFREIHDPTAFVFLWLYQCVEQLPVWGSVLRAYSHLRRLGVTNGAI
jgi:hypothetical protein